MSINELVLSVVGVILVGLANYALKELVVYLRSKVSSEHLATARVLAERVVAAAEQYGLTNVITNAGESKKEWALAHLESILAARGIKIDLHELSSLIEAVVQEKFTQDKASWLVTAAALADEAVMFVEQTGAGQSNDEKKNRAIAWLDDALFTRGICLKSTEVEALVEAAVYRLPPTEELP